MTQNVRLREFCSCRAGDKGNSADVTIFASEPEFYPVLVRELTADRVAGHFAPLGVAGVRRYEVPNLYGLKFVIAGALGGGGAASLRADNLGKNMGGTLLRLAIPLPDDLAAVVPSPRPPAHPFT
jgi:hypothetical protein